MNPTRLNADSTTRFHIFVASRGIERIKEAQQNHTESLLALGAALYEFYTNNWYQYVPDPDNDGYGFASFDKWLRSDADLSYSTCRLALQTYELLVVRAGYDMAALSTIAVGKLQEIVPEIKAIYELRDSRVDELSECEGAFDERMELIAGLHDAAEQRVADWLADAQVLSRTDLKQRRVEVKGGRVWQGLINYGDVPEHLRDRFDPGEPINARYMQLPE